MIYDTSDTLKGELGFCQTTNMFNIYLKRCLKAILDLKDDGGGGKFNILIKFEKGKDSCQITFAKIYF